MAAQICFFYGFFWLFRRFGFLAVLAQTLINALGHATPYISLTAWYASRMLVTDGMVLALGAWAVWVIAQGHSKRAVDTA